jgi:hypothetical protein
VASPRLEIELPEGGRYDGAGLAKVAALGGNGIAEPHR